MPQSSSAEVHNNGMVLKVIVLMNGSIHIGTSGWSYKHWRQRFYPEDVKPPVYLAYYAKHFNTTEINTSFYHLPKPETVLHWVETVRNSFRFCPKISRYITHIKKLNDPEETLPKFFDLFDPVKSHLGPVLIQLPPNLVFHEQRATAFYRALKKFSGYRFALEPRNDSWFTGQSIALLKKNRIAFVLADSGGRRTYAEYITARHIYIRFHGPGSFDCSYGDRFLKKFAKKILAWKKNGHAVWAFFNNDGNAHAVFNAKKLIELTG
jgi:uncharacterized protein YecE (DUF72 family)